MAENVEMIRPINLPEAQQLSENDVFILDSETGGVRKIPKNKVYTPVDDTLSESGEAADAKVTGEKIDELKGETALIQNPVGNKSGELVSFTDGAEMPAKSVIVNIEPQQSGTGTPSPDNVRQISGWESVSVYDAGKNLFDKSVMAKNWYITGSNTIGNGGTCLLFSVPIGTAFTVSGTNGGRNRLLASDKPYNELAVGDALTSLSNTNLPLHLTSQYRTYIYYCETSFNQAIADSIQVEVGNTATTYEPYTGTNTHVNLGRTVYGGTLDVVSGVLTVTHGIVDLGTLTSWTRITNGSVYIFDGDIYEMSGSAVLAAEILCSNYASVNKSGFGLANGECARGQNSKHVYIRDDSYTSAVDFKTAMNGVQLVYELATPQTYTLTPTEVKTLLGENNVWADSGDVEITYRRDINIVIDELTNAIVSLGANV